MGGAKGPGIPISDRERIWSPYVRLRREQSMANEGSGIGLAVVRELAELHGGEAYVEATERGGSRFVVEVPMVRTASDDDRSLPPTARRDRARDRSRAPQSWASRARRRLLRGSDSPTGHS